MFRIFNGFENLGLLLSVLHSVSKPPTKISQLINPQNVPIQPTLFRPVSSMRVPVTKNEPTTPITRLDKKEIAQYSQRDEVWLERYEELRDFCQKYGHCNVTPKIDKRLNAWVQTQRRARRAGTMAQYKIQLLDKVAFQWDRSYVLGPIWKERRWGATVDGIPALTSTSTSISISTSTSPSPSRSPPASDMVSSISSVTLSSSSSSLSSGTTGLHSPLPNRTTLNLEISEDELHDRNEETSSRDLAEVDSAAEMIESLTRSTRDKQQIG